MGLLGFGVWGVRVSLGFGVVRAQGLGLLGFRVTRIFRGIRGPKSMREFQFVVLFWVP